MDIELKNKLEKFYDETVWQHITLGEFVSECSSSFGNKVALVDGNKEFTYDELDRKSDEYANGLLKAGFKAGDKIVLQFPNCSEFVLILFSMFKIGVIPVLTLPAHRKNELKGIIEESKAVAYIGKDRYLGFSYVDMIRDIKDDIENEFEIYILGENQEYKNFYELIDKDYLYQIKTFDYRSTGLLLLSGGTTGKPKLIPRRHCDYIYVAAEVAKRCKMGSESVYLAALPIAHNFPLCCPGILGTFSVGGKVVLSSVTSPDEILPLIEEEKVTITGLVPAIANVCMEFLKEGDYDVSSLEILQVGGSVLEPQLAKRIEREFNTKLQQIFGIAEGLIMTTDILDSDFTRF